MKLLNKKCIVIILQSSVLLAMEVAEQTPKLLETLKNSSAVLSVAYSSAATKLAVCGYAKSVDVWETKDFKQPRFSFEQKMLCPALDTNSHNELAVGSGGKVTVYDMDTGDLLDTLEGGTLVVATQYNSLGELLLVGHTSTICNIWDAKSAKEVAHLPEQAGILADAKWKPWGNQIAVSYAGEKIVRLWDTRVWKCTDTIHPVLEIDALEYTPSGNQLFGAACQQYQVFDTKTGGHTATYELYGRKLAEREEAPINMSKPYLMANVMRFIPNHPDILVAGLSDDDIVFFDIKDSSKAYCHKLGKNITHIQTDLKTLNGRLMAGKYTDAMSISCDGKRLAAGSFYDKETKIWDISEIDEKLMAIKKAVMEKEKKLSTWSCDLQ